MTGFKKSLHFFVSSEVTQKLIMTRPLSICFSDVWLVRWIACVPCDWSLNWKPFLMSSPVPLPDLYFESFFYPVAPIVLGAGGIV